MCASCASSLSYFSYLIYIYLHTYIQVLIHSFFKGHSSTKEREEKREKDKREENNGSVVSIVSSFVHLEWSWVPTSISRSLLLPKTIYLELASRLYALKLVCLPCENVGCERRRPGRTRRRYAYYLFICLQHFLMHWHIFILDHLQEKLKNTRRIVLQVVSHFPFP